jgi:hypothetical protein
MEAGRRRMKDWRRQWERVGGRDDNGEEDVMGMEM